jgi:hypothetical protein
MVVSPFFEIFFSQGFLLFSVNRNPQSKFPEQSHGKQGSWNVPDHSMPIDSSYHPPVEGQAGHCKHTHTPLGRLVNCNFSRLPEKTFYIIVAVLNQSITLYISYAPVSFYLLVLPTFCDIPGCTIHPGHTRPPNNNLIPVQTFCKWNRRLIVSTARPSVLGKKFLGV